jgi:hypothetical protein
MTFPPQRQTRSALGKRRWPRIPSNTGGWRRLREGPPHVPMRPPQRPRALARHRRRKRSSAGGKLASSHTWRSSPSPPCHGSAPLPSRSSLAGYGRGISPPLLRRIAGAPPCCLRASIASARCREEVGSFAPPPHWCTAPSRYRRELELLRQRREEGGRGRARGGGCDARPAPVRAQTSSASCPPTSSSTRRATCPQGARA